MSDGASELPKTTDRWLDALEWHTTLSEVSGSQLTGARIRDWQQWHAEPENRRVFEQLDRLLEDALASRRRGRRTRGELDADTYDPSVPVREWPHSRRAAPTASGISHGRAWRDWAPAVTVLAAAAALSAALILRPAWLGITSGARSSAVYRTGVGQLESVRLSDGSAVTLGARTRLSIDFTSRRRIARLRYGEAWFRDRDIPNRPFTVTAGGGTITAVGTSFVVNRDCDRVVVTVTAGTVEVSAAAPASPPHSLPPGASSRPLRPVVRLMRGEAIVYTDSGALGAVTRASTRAATAWTQGRLIFDDAPLRDVLENVDRYWSHRITAGRRAGRLRFSGLIYENGIRDWLNGLSTILPVEIDETHSSICVHERRDARQTPPVSCPGGR